MPLVKDEVAHIFFQAEHLATVHHHHGDHHAEEEIAEAAHEEKNNQNTTTIKTSEPVSVHVVVQLLYAPPQPGTTKQKYEFSTCNILSVFLKKDFPPPKSFLPNYNLVA